MINHITKQNKRVKKHEKLDTSEEEDSEEESSDAPKHKKHHKDKASKKKKEKEKKKKKKPEVNYNTRVCGYDVLTSQFRRGRDTVSSNMKMMKPGGVGVAVSKRRVQQSVKHLNSNKTRNAF